MEILEDTLLEVGLSLLLTTVILNCVSSSSLQILWNEVVTNPFRLARDIRQGDPLSPYLFVLYMEHLGHLIEEAIEQKEARVYLTFFYR